MVSRSTRTCDLCISHLGPKTGDGWEDEGEQLAMWSLHVLFNRNGEPKNTENSQKSLRVVGVDLMSQMNLMTSNMFLTIKDSWRKTSLVSYRSYVHPMTDDILKFDYVGLFPATFHSGNSRFPDYVRLLNGGQLYPFVGRAHTHVETCTEGFCEHFFGSLFGLPAFVFCQ